MCASLFLKLYGKLKHNFCKHRIVVVGYGVAGKECMDSKFFGTFGFQDAECIKNLLGSHSVFCISRIIHDTVADLEYSAWIITAADHFRNSSESSLYALNMCNIIKIDDSTDLICIFELFLRCIVGGEHDIALLAAHCFCHHKLCGGGAVTAAAILLKNVDQIRVRCCFYCKKFLESFVPGESLFQSFCILTDSLLIIKMERCRIFFGNLVEFLKCHKWYFFHNNCISCFPTAVP